MDIYSLMRQGTLPGQQAQAAAPETPGNGQEFSNALNGLDDAPEDSPEPDASSTAAPEEPQLSEQERLRQERLEKFGSYTAYSLWRKIPAMAAGIIEPKPESYIEQYGLLEYWHNERAHWQGEVRSMSEAERQASGTRLLDDEGPESTGQAGSASDAATQTAAANTVSNGVAQAVAANTVSGAAAQTDAPANASGQTQPTPAVIDDGPVATPEPATSVPEAASATDQAEQADPVVQAQPATDVKSQQELRAERLERFGSYTAYSLWRKIPAMAAGIIQPKSEAFIEQHGLLEYWRNERDHWQGQVRAMSEAQRAASNTRLLDE